MKCMHKVMVDGAGPFRADLVCKNCGTRILMESRLRSWHLFLVWIRFRKEIEILEGELFHGDGVY